MTDTPNHYATLRVSPLADLKEIEAAYRRLAREYHPDVNRASDAADRMAAVNVAWAVLRDPEARAAYDRERRNAFTPPPAPGRDPMGSARVFEQAQYSLYPPVLEWSPEILELGQIDPGTSVTGVLRLRNCGGGQMSGAVRTNSPQLRASPNRFTGNDVVIRVEAALAPEDRPRRTEGHLAWRIMIDSNGGEGSVTVRAPYSPPREDQRSLGVWMFRIEALGVLLLFLLLIAFPLWQRVANGG